MACCIDGLKKIVGGPQLGLVPPKKFTYFALATPVGLPCMCLLEMSGKPYDGKAVGFEEWGELKPKTPSGQLPYAEMPDGTYLVESGAIGRVIAGSAGFLGQGKDYAISEMLCGIINDMNKAVFEVCPTMMTIKDFDATKHQAFMDKKQAILDFFSKCAKHMLPAGDRFTSSGLSYGEISLFCHLYCYANGALPEAKSGPLASFYERMAAVPGIKKVLDGKSKFGNLAGYLLPLPS